MDLKDIIANERRKAFRLFNEVIFRDALEAGSRGVKPKRAQIHIMLNDFVG